MKKKQWISLLLTFLAIGHVLEAEIEKIEMTWNSFKCQNSCVAQIEQNLRAIPQVKNLKVDAAEGAAFMSWAIDYPFSYEPFRYASAAVGIHISTLRVRVRGMVKHDSNHFYLVSAGDNTTFTLVGPLQTEPGRYSPLNLSLHPLTPDIQGQLLEAEKTGSIIMISGPLYLPSHYNLILVTEQIKLH